MHSLDRKMSLSEKSRQRWGSMMAVVLLSAVVALSAGTPRVSPLLEDDRAFSARAVFELVGRAQDPGASEAQLAVACQPVWNGYAMKYSGTTPRWLVSLRVAPDVPTRCTIDWLGSGELELQPLNVETDLRRIPAGGVRVEAWLEDATSFMEQIP